MDSSFRDDNQNFIGQNRWKLEASNARFGENLNYDPLKQRVLQISKNTSKTSRKKKRQRHNEFKRLQKRLQRPLNSTDIDTLYSRYRSLDKCTHRRNCECYHCEIFHLLPSSSSSSSSSVTSFQSQLIEDQSLSSGSEADSQTTCCGSNIWNNKVTPFHDGPTKSYMDQNLNGVQIKEKEAEQYTERRRPGLFENIKLSLGFIFRKIVLPFCLVYSVLKWATLLFIAFVSSVFWKRRKSRIISPGTLPSKVVLRFKKEKYGNDDQFLV